MLFGMVSVTLCGPKRHLKRRALADQVGGRNGDRRVVRVLGARAQPARQL